MRLEHTLVVDYDENGDEIEKDVTFEAELEPAEPEVGCPPTWIIEDVRFVDTGKLISADLFEVCHEELANVADDALVTGLERAAEIRYDTMVENTRKRRKEAI